MRTFFKFTLGLGLSTTCILYFFAFFLLDAVRERRLPGMACDGARARNAAELMLFSFLFCRARGGRRPAAVF